MWSLIISVHCNYMSHLVYSCKRTFLLLPLLCEKQQLSFFPLLATEPIHKRKKKAALIQLWWDFFFVSCREIASERNQALWNSGTWWVKAIMWVCINLWYNLSLPSFRYLLADVDTCNIYHQSETKVGTRISKFWSFILSGKRDLNVLLKELLQKMWEKKSLQM